MGNGSSTSKKSGEIITSDTVNKVKPSGSSGGLVTVSSTGSILGVPEEPSFPTADIETENAIMLALSTQGFGSQESLNSKDLERQQREREEEEEEEEEFRRKEEIETKKRQQQIRRQQLEHCHRNAPTMTAADIEPDMEAELSPPSLSAPKIAFDPSKFKQAQTQSQKVLQSLNFDDQGSAQDINGIKGMEGIGSVGGVVLAAVKLKSAKVEALEKEIMGEVDESIFASSACSLDAELDDLLGGDILNEVEKKVEAERQWENALALSDIRAEQLTQEQAQQKEDQKDQFSNPKEENNSLQQQTIVNDLIEEEVLTTPTSTA